MTAHDPAIVRRTMTNLHRLAPCALCAVRMAVPGGRVCVMCDVVLPALVVLDEMPDYYEAD